MTNGEFRQLALGLAGADDITLAEAIKLLRSNPGLLASLPTAKSRGPGSELKKLLSRFKILSTGTCQCDGRADIMDERGPDWCGRNIPVIVGWLKAEARERRLPFTSLGATLLVKLAIRNARKNS